jgi:SAM-dependent methyltransferase
MATTAPPRIFSPTRRIALRGQMLALQQAVDAPRYLMEDYVEDVLERLAFVQFEPGRALVIGDFTGELIAALGQNGTDVASTEPANGFDEERPFPGSGYDLVVSLGTLDTVNDLPGALVHIRHALTPGGMLIASFPGAGSLPVLRAAMLAADAERPHARLHPMVDVRAGGQLLQRTGFTDPVIDSRSLDVNFGSLATLVADLRAQGLSSVLADPGPPLGRAALARARTAFAQAGENGRTTERFEILTLSGWRR